MNQSFKRAFDSLDKIFDFTREFVEKTALSESIAFTLNLVIEEIFTNMVKYNSQGKMNIELKLKRTKGKLTIGLIDPDSEFFDITQVDSPDLDVPLEERKIGGLGLHFVKEMVDNIGYEYENRVTTITLTKYLED